MEARSGFTSFTLSIVLLIIHIASVSGQCDEPLMPSSGPYSVGFKTIFKYDKSRIYFPKYDALGNERTGERTRPMQIGIWYPADPNAQSVKMTTRDYVLLSASKDKDVEPTESEIGTALGYTQLLFQKTSHDQFKKVMAAAGIAEKKAGEKSGKFPVIIYAPSMNADIYENYHLMEFLASYGYLVLASPSRGETSFMTMDMAGIEAQERDIRFLINYAEGLPNADISKIAVIGFSWGGISNIIAKMHDDRIQALIGLDGSARYYPQFLKESKDFDIRKMDVPYLSFVQSPDNLSIERLTQRIAEHETDLSFNLYNSVTEADAYLFTMKKMGHGNFSSVAVLMAEPKTEEDFPRQEIEESYRWVSVYLLNFLKAYLSGEPKSMEFMHRSPFENGVPPRIITAQSKSGERSIRHIYEFANRVKAVGFDKISQIYADIQKNDKAFVLKEDEMNNWGYELLGGGHVKESIEVFKLNVQLHPQGSNTYDSLGEAYMTQGDKKQAIKNYKKSLELDPKNTNAVEMLKKLEGK